MTLTLPLLTQQVPPWRALPLLVAGLVVPRVGPRTAAVAMMLAAAPLWAAPASAAVAWAHVSLMTLAALWGVWSASHRPGRVLALAGLLATLGALLGARQVLLDVPGAVQSGVGLFLTGVCLGLGLLSWPGPARGGRVLLVAGILLAVEGQLWLASLSQRSVAEAAVLLSERGAAAGWRSLTTRALTELRKGDPEGALAIVHARPWETVPGRQVAERSGASVAVRAGWQPMEELPPELAVETALALDGVGERGRALWLLRRHPRRGEVAFALSMLAAEEGDEALARQAWSRATVPAGTVAAPGILVAGLTLATDGAHVVEVAAPEGIGTLQLRARGEAYRGLPELTVNLGGRRLDTLAVPEDGGHWTWPVALEAGAYRLVLRFDNDAQDTDGDRNVVDIVVIAR